MLDGNGMPSQVINTSYMENVSYQ
ncbi:hypothetical protein KQQSB11_290067 [Klebsiella quasipneumoniae subsp. quasipneumoniae]|nr:hypothetical protein KQQSB11_290067 [Klebsiella quasipneumoniae subsp. quasipneumoniae]